MKGSKDELDELAVTFNGMVERVQRLISGMKEVTDNVADDLRSPVTRMKGLAQETLTDGVRPTSIRPWLGPSSRNATDCWGMINAILEISEESREPYQLRIRGVRYRGGRPVCLRAVSARCRG